MKTKPFLLATAGATVDGRTIDAAMLQQMAEDYDPATYAARLNIEHLRGISPSGPFGAYGDVLELSTADVEVKFGDKTETRVGLYGVFEVTDEAKALNDAGQKLYPSIEINPNFADKGRAYLMGCALTDSPASVATERMQFNRALPGALTLGANDAAQAFALEFAADSGKAGDAAEGLVAKFGAMLDSVFSKHAPKTDDAGEPKGKEGDDAPQAFSADALKPVFEGFAKDIAGQFTQLQDQIDQLSVRVKAAETAAENNTPSTYTQRPPATGAHGNQELASY